LSWHTLTDLSALPPYPSSNGFNDWDTPYNIDLSLYTGETVDIAWHAVDGDGNGLWYPWAIDDCTVGTSDLSTETGNGLQKGFSSSKSSPDALSGYNIYRRKGKDGDFLMINPVPVNDTSYQDPVSLTDTYYYFIQGIYEECEYSSNSDTVVTDFITGLDGKNIPGIRLYPNPSVDHFTIESIHPLCDITLYSIEGRVINSWNAHGNTRFIGDITKILNGLYLFRISLPDKDVLIKHWINHQ
jgi:hypothetical protein